MLGKFIQRLIESHTFMGLKCLHPAVNDMYLPPTFNKHPRMSNAEEDAIAARSTFNNLFI